MRMPPSTRWGLPFFTKAISVVVPPISTTTQSFAAVSSAAPITLATGPQRRVSTGRLAVKAELIRLPSLRTITMGAVMPLFFNALDTALRNSSITEIRRALSNALAPRFIMLLSENRLWPHTTGISRACFMYSRACFSSTAPDLWANISTTPTASQSLSSSGIFPLKSAQSGGAIISPEGRVWLSINIMSSFKGRPYSLPTRATFSGFTPKRISFARPPLFSTQAFVARVVERAITSDEHRYSRGSSSSASPIPTERSCFVVGALPKASIFLSSKP